MGSTGVRRRRRSPPTHWVLFVALLMGLLAALLIAGYSHHVHGRSTTATGGAGAPGFGDAGPIIDLRVTPPRSVPVPERTMSLTFDDGPDPRWTPAILDVLRAHGARATFFVTGSQVLAHPGLTRRILREGHELGNHTFSHADLAGVPGWLARLELAMAERALAGVTSTATALLRLPYTSTPAALTVDQVRAARHAAGAGYLIVAATHDGKDWQRPGAEAILDRITPVGDAGAVVLLHDSGGNRSQTVAALGALLPSLRDRGYRFVTVGQLAGIPQGADAHRTTGAAHLQGLLLMWASRVAGWIATALTFLLIPVGLLSIARAAAVVLFARGHAARARRVPVEASFRPGVTVVVPAYNEAVGITGAVTSLSGSYTPLEIIVVDDGSTDGTGDIVTALGLPDVTVVRQPNHGKAIALNTGMARASHEIIVMVDGDTVFEPDTVAHLVQPFADPTVGAVSGNTKVGNRRGLLGRWQHIEYVIGFNLDRRMYDRLRCMPTVPGAVGAFRRRALDEVGWVGEETLAEDTDLTMAVNRAGWRVAFEERAVAWTEAPSSVGALWRQRYRWCYGTLQAMWKHRGAVREAGPLGRYGLPYLLGFQVLLPLLAPAIDLVAIYALLFLDPVPVVGFWLGFLVLQLALGYYAFRLDGERPTALWAAPLQQLVYRQLMYLVVIQSVFSAVSGTRLRWHKLDRRGLPVGAGAPAVDALRGVNNR